MKQQDIIRYLLIALVVTGILRFFFPPKKEAPATDADRSFVAPTRAEIVEPLDLEIDFADTSVGPEKTTIVETPNMILNFSNHGAVVKRIGYKRDDSQALMETMVPTGREHGLFLVALSSIGSTPYEYELVSHTAGDAATTLTYHGESPLGIVRKQFTVPHNSYLIDLEVTFEPKQYGDPEPYTETELSGVVERVTESDEVVGIETTHKKDEGYRKPLTRIRLLFDGPCMKDLIPRDTLKAVLYTTDRTFKTIPVSDIGRQGKEEPTFFGLENRYFVTMLIADPDQFALRAYFKVEGTETAQAILQTNRLYEGAVSRTWHLSFYCGPKEVAALASVDARLESYINYGFFWFLAKPMLSVLLFLHRLFDSYGLAIILLTILLHLLMLPFSLAVDAGQQKQKDFEKKRRALQERYRHDQKELEIQEAALVRKHASGLLMAFVPLFMQIPILIALRTVLADAIELYRVPFLWIPDLSLPDPYYILPAVMGCAIFVRMTMTTKKPQEIVRNLIITLVIIGIAFINMSAGLALYICLTLLCGLVQLPLARSMRRWRRG